MQRSPLLIVSLIATLGVTSPSYATLFDHSSYDSVLRLYVGEDGYVDYDAVRQNSLSALESYLQMASEAELIGWPYAERLAFWINIYNARVLYVLAEKASLTNVRMDPDIFKEPFLVAKQKLSLHDIQHRILRGRINPDNKKGTIAGLSLSQSDPRIHFALASGTLSSGRLRNFAYTDENVEDTLQADASYTANSAMYVAVADGQLRLTKILLWYKNDFSSSGGVAAYLDGLVDIQRRSDADLIHRLLRTQFTQADYVYDWTLNSVKLKKTRTPRREESTSSPAPEPTDHPIAPLDIYTGQ